MKIFAPPTHLAFFSVFVEGEVLSISLVQSRPIFNLPYFAKKKTAKKRWVGQPAYFNVIDQNKRF
jgi:hypothetical protein